MATPPEFQFNIMAFDKGNKGSGVTGHVDAFTALKYYYN